MKRSHGISPQTLTYLVTGLLLCGPTIAAYAASSCSGIFIE